jgi:ankyrin repeat protein
MNRHLEVFKLLQGESASATLMNEARWTPLHCKAINNELGFVKTLAYSGFEVFFNETDKTWTPLQFAIENALETAIRRLLEVGFNIKTKYDQTSLQ